MPLDDLRRIIYVTTSIDEYRNVFSDDWASRIAELVKGKVRIDELVFDLTMEWRAAVYTAALPVSILEHMKRFHDTYINHGELNTTLLRLAEIIPGTLAQRVPALTSHPALIRELQREIVKIGADFESARDKVSFEFPLEESWQDYLKETVFQLSLWGSQRICYVAIYNAYDNFLQQCVRIELAQPNYRPKPKQFQQVFTKCFGATLLHTCWTNDDLSIARSARHSLSHAGGRLTPELADKKHGFELKQDRIQIVPEKTKQLLVVLKDAVQAMAEKAVTMPKFA